MIQFGWETCNDLNASLHREFLETNGIGGFASSTMVGHNTRRDHGLLIAATRPPVGRLVRPALVISHTRKNLKYRRHTPE